LPIHCVEIMLRIQIIPKIIVTGEAKALLQNKNNRIILSNILTPIKCLHLLNGDINSALLIYK